MDTQVKLEMQICCEFPSEGMGAQLYDTATIEAFHREASCLSRQYSQYTVAGNKLFSTELLLQLLQHILFHHFLLPLLFFQSLLWMVTEHLVRTWPTMGASAWPWQHTQSGSREM